MIGKSTIIVLLRDVMVIVLLSAIIFGVIGFLLVGRDGFVNGATWGIVLELFGIPFVLLRYVRDPSASLGNWWAKRGMEGDDEARRHGG